jgi:hypothetical protein
MLINGLLQVSATASGSIMNTRKFLTVFAVIALVVGLPFVILRLAAAPDDASHTRPVMAQLGS